MSRRGLRLSRGSLRPSWRGLCLSQSGLRLSRRGLRLSRRGLRVSHSCLQPGVFISPPSPDGLDSAVLRCCPSLRRWRAACRGLRPGSFLWPPRQMAWPAGGVAWRRRRRRAALRVPESGPVWPGGENAWPSFRAARRDRRPCRTPAPTRMMAACGKSGFGHEPT